MIPPHQSLSAFSLLFDTTRASTRLYVSSIHCHHVCYIKHVFLIDLASYLVFYIFSHYLLIYIMSKKWKLLSYRLCIYVTWFNYHIHTTFQILFRNIKNYKKTFNEISFDWGLTSFARKNDENCFSCFITVSQELLIIIYTELSIIYSELH